MLNNVVGYLSGSGDLYSAGLIFGGGLIFGVSICGGSLFGRGGGLIVGGLWYWIATKR